MRLFTLLPVTAFTALILCAQTPQTAGEIRGYAWDASGRPVPEAKITIHAAGEQTDRTLTAGKDGLFDVKNLAPGHYELTAEAGKLQLATEDVTPLDIKAGEIQHADLTLGLNTTHYGFWKRLGRRLDGMH